MDSRPAEVSRRALFGLISGAAVALTACAGRSTMAKPPGASSGPSPAPSLTTTPPVAQASSAPSTGIKILFMADIGGDHIKVRDAWAKKFSEQTGIQVQHQPVVQNYQDTLLTRFAGGDPPDIFRYLQEQIPIVEAVGKRMLHPLNDFIKRDNYDLSDFLPQAIDLYRWKSDLYALPRDYGNQNIFYNVTLLEKAGLGRLPTEWTDKSFTFDRYLEVAKQLTKTEGGRVTQWGCAVNRAWRPWASWVYSNGGTVVKSNADGIATELTLDQPPAVEALQFLQDLMYKYRVSSTPEMETDQPVQDLFMSGRIAMVIDNPGAVKSFRAIKSFEWDVAPFPLGKGEKRAVGGGGTGWAIAGASKQADAAWKFLQFISSKEAELDEVHIGGTTPSRKSVVNSEDFLDPKRPPRNSKGFAEAQDYVIRDPVHPNWYRVQREVLVKILDDLWLNKAPASEVAKRMKQQADKILRG